MKLEYKYLSLLVPWLDALPKYLRTHGEALSCKYYGTGESQHWPMQSNMNVLAALAVLGTTPSLKNAKTPVSRDELISLALSMFRYAMRTHRAVGDINATDGKRWGLHWISTLGPERMAHGINLLEPFMTDRDKQYYRDFRVAESGWILKEQKVQAAMDARSNANVPESNIWSGAFLLRTALDYPDLPDAAEYREKATDLFVNGISHPSDVADDSTIYGGKTVRERHKGFNYTPSYSLDHHGYLNVGYMLICLSNIAMLHFNLKQRGQSAPPEIYHHARDLWNVVKRFFTFPDGRLLRIGGDTRARYTYCQCYAIPSWLLMADLYGDTDAVSFENAWLDVMAREANANDDGMFYSKRLSGLRDTSYFYYCRLESDPVLALSCGACWRNLFQLPEPDANGPSYAAGAWRDDFHGAAMVREGNTARSFVRSAAHGMHNAMCVPLNRSDLGEWQGNLCGILEGVDIQEYRRPLSRTTSFTGGFIARATSNPTETKPAGEGEAVCQTAIHKMAIAALPDGKSMIVIQYCEMTKETTLKSVRSLHLQIPNDVYNDYMRTYTGIGFERVLKTGNDAAEVIDTKSDRLNVDNCLSAFLLGGGDSLKINRSAKQNIGISNTMGSDKLYSLYADEICVDAEMGILRRMRGEILFDTACAVSADVTAEQTLAHVKGCYATRDSLRIAEFTGFDGVVYTFIVNFGRNPAAYEYESETCLVGLNDGLLLAGGKLIAIHKIS